VYAEGAKPPPYPLPQYGSRYWGSSWFHFDAYIVGFCGTCYPLLRFSERDPDMPTKSIHTHLYSLQEVKDFARKRLKDKQYDRWIRNKHVDKRRWGNKDCPSQIERFFQKYDEYNASGCDLFIKHEVPVFVANEDQLTVTYNTCRLHKLDFQRIFDPYSAYQEIQMFVTNDLPVRSNKPTKYMGKKMDDTVADKDMIVAKGFDLKSSFRKPPSKKR
jgi:hypothetical protein